MQQPKQTEAALAHLRVLDLSDGKGLLCGKILGDLGADVIKVEPPGGDPARNTGPFYHDTPHPEKSLYWLAFNINKRGITLDIATADGQELFRRLVHTADVVIETFPPGYMDNLGLGYFALSQINPSLVMTSITPFGQEGPYRNYKGPDIVAMALGGIMYLTGDPDRPPVRISFPQAYLLAGAEAAVGTLMACYHRRRTGEGQHVDVSAQACVVWTMMNARMFWDLNKGNLRRAGSYRVGLSSGAKHQQTWPCKDGYVTYTIVSYGKGAAGSMQALGQWMTEEGVADPPLTETDWSTFDMATATQEFFDQISEPMREFFQRHTRAELYEEAVKRRVMLYPVATAKDWLESQQLAARNYWVEVPHPELDTTITYPGPFIKASETPLKIRRRAPRIGEHNREIYEGELGLSPQELSILKQSATI